MNQCLFFGLLNSPATFCIMAFGFLNCPALFRLLWIKIKMTKCNYPDNIWWSVTDLNLAFVSMLYTCVPNIIWFHQLFLELSSGQAFTVDDKMMSDKSWLINKVEIITEPYFEKFSGNNSKAPGGFWLVVGLDLHFMNANQHF